MANQPFGILSPSLGVKQNYPSILLQDAFMPDQVGNIKNVILNNGEIHSIRLREKEFSQQLSDPILLYDQFWKKDLTFQLMACTKRDICYRDSANDRFNYVTPQYSTGKIRVENGSTMVQGGVEVDNCDDAVVQWADGSGGDVTPSRQTTSPKDGTAFVRLTVAASAGVELLAYHDLAAPQDITAYDSVGFWIRSSVNTSAGDLQFLIDETAACVSPDEQIDIPALTANTWTWVNLAMSDPSILNAVASIGIYQAVDIGACTIDIDQVVVGDWAGQLKAGDFITIGTTYSTDDTWYEVSSVTDTQITLTSAYAGSTASQQDYLARVTYTGTNTDFWYSETFNNKWLATNGVDNVQSYSGSGQAADLAGSPPVAKYMRVFENYVILANLSGTSEPYTYQWCAIGDETNWTTGDSGSSEIDDYYPITGFGELQGFLFMFTENTVEKIWLVGGSLVFNRTRLTSDVGAWAPRSIIERKNAIYFYARDNTFRRLTGYSWDRISDNFETYIKDIHPEYEKQITGTYIEAQDVFLWAIPDATSTGRLNKVLIYDDSTTRDVWSIKDIEVLAFGTYEVEDSYTWDTIPFSTWDEISWDKWDTRSGFEGAPRNLCSDYSGDTFRMFSSEEDNEVSYTREFVLATDLTKNKSSIYLNKRLSLFQCVFRKETTGTVTVYYKRDYEQSWQLAGTVDLTSSEDEFLFLDVYVNTIAKNFLFRFSATNRFRFIGLIFPEDGYDFLERR